MDTNVVAQVLGDALTTAIKLSAPMLLLAMVIGIGLAIFQAVTQIHEQSLAFVLKMVTICVVLMVAGEWMLENLQDYAREIFAAIGA